MKKNGQYVGIDEKYIPEEEKYVDNMTNNELKETINNGMRSVNDYVTDKGNQKKFKSAGKKGFKVLKGIGIGYLICIGIVIILTIIVFIIVFTNMSRANDRVDEVYNKAGSFIEGLTDEMDDNSSSNNSNDNSSSGNITRGYNNTEAKVFNAPFELYNGLQSGMFLDMLLDQVVTNNKTEADHIITVVYNETMTAVPDEITALKQNLEDSKEYEVSLDYDADGFVNKVTIK